MHRIFNPLISQSFFLFGARETGKTTYLQNEFKGACHYINLLEQGPLLRYSRNPDQIILDLKAINLRKKWVVIDEIQKIPALLDLVHHLIEKERYKFILTGSSARKLKRQSANLLGGRAFYYNMFPLTFLELKDKFILSDILRWGSLPKIFSLNSDEKSEFLRSYTQVYLKEEILQEQIVRNGLAFRSFLEVAAQENGKLLNFSKIARDVGVETKTIQSYFQILEDTLLGYFLPAYHLSTRKSVGQQPKFYLFDLGVKSALEGSLKNEPQPSSYAYGDAFEHFIICETIRLNSYSRSDYQFSHYHTTSGGEVDLVLRRGKNLIAVEIKSSSNLDEKQVLKFARSSSALKPTKSFFVSQDTTRSKIGEVVCLHWQDFFKELFCDYS